MSFQCDAESGFQLLSRCDSRLSVVGLDPVVFRDGPKLNDIIEISGDPGTGKTLLITQYLVKSLLPSKWKDNFIGGFCVGVVLVNTDHHFQLFKLVSMMEMWLMKCGDNENEKKTFFNSETIEEIIKDSLKRLIILNCHDNTQFRVTLHSLEGVLNANHFISLVVIDSISAYYWLDTLQGGIKKMDLYIKQTLKSIRNYLKKYKVLVLYTKQLYFQSANKLPRYSEDDSSLVDYKIELHKPEDNSLYYANINFKSDEVVCQYSIEPHGICWVE